jgi:hypothetical protein
VVPIQLEQGDPRLAQPEVHALEATPIFFRQTTPCKVGFLTCHSIYRKIIFVTSPCVTAFCNLRLIYMHETMGKRNKVKPSKPESEGNSKYNPTPEEMEAFKSHFLKRETQTAPRVKVAGPKDRTILSFDHQDSATGQVLLMEALGTADYDFLSGLLEQLSNGSCRGGKVDEKLLNFMLAVIKGIKPRDQIEIMLAAQMAAVHEAIMTFTRRLAHVETTAQQDSAERALNKLARTFATQMEALQRHRNGGEQKVMVQQVSVSEGGQAIVGNVTHNRDTSQERVKEQLLVPHQPRPSQAVVDRQRERTPILIEQIEAQKVPPEK